MGVGRKMNKPTICRSIEVMCVSGSKKNTKHIQNWKRTIDLTRNLRSISRFSFDINSA